MAIAIYVDAGHDKNGNPRRGWIITSETNGSFVDFVDEGYEGISALRRDYGHTPATRALPITPACYRELKHDAEKRRRG